MSPAATNNDGDLRARKRAAWISLVVGGGMLLIKAYAYQLTLSTAILSDALESVVHIVATAFAFYSVMLSAKPADASHPYGHGKVEFFSAGFEGGLIAMAGLAILYKAGASFLTGPEIHQLSAGMGLTLGAGLLNLGLGGFLIRTGRRTGSITLIADGRHVLSDSFTSLGVVVGLALVYFTGVTVIDPLVAMAVGTHIIVMGIRLIRESVSGLMDEADPQFLREVIATVDRHREPAWIDLHRLRGWKSGDRRHLDCHLVLPRFWDIERAHAVEEQIERLVAEALPGPVDLIVHRDPCTAVYCATCSVVDCPVRTAAFTRRQRWDLTTATQRVEKEGLDQ